MEALLSSFIVSLAIFLILILVNTVLAYAVALHVEKNFDRKLMLRFLKTKIAPYLITWGIASIVLILISLGVRWAGYQIELGANVFSGIVSASSLFIITRIWGRIYDKLKKLGFDVKKIAGNIRKK